MLSKFASLSEMKDYVRKNKLNKASITLSMKKSDMLAALDKLGHIHSGPRGTSSASSAKAKSPPKSAPKAKTPVKAKKESKANKIRITKKVSLEDFNKNLEKNKAAPDFIKINGTFTDDELMTRFNNTDDWKRFNLTLQKRLFHLIYTGNFGEASKPKPKDYLDDWTKIFSPYEVREIVRKHKEFLELDFKNFGRASENQKKETEKLRQETIDMIEKILGDDGKVLFTKMETDMFLSEFIPRMIRDDWTRPELGRLLRGYQKSYMRSADGPRYPKKERHLHLKR